jgi:hypothetical protein
MLLSLGAQLFAASLPAADHAALATAPGGRSVVVWEGPTIYGLHDIHAQIFDPSGDKVGGDILVAGDRENQYDPTVAVNADGKFVVTWTMDYSPTDTDVHAALFAADGTLLAPDFDVAATWKREFDPSAGIDANGNFVISYTLQFGPGDQDVLAKTFDANANLLRSIDVAVSPANENHSHVLMNADGSFAISYLLEGTPEVKRFAADDQFLGGGEVSGQGQGQGQGQGHKDPGPEKPPHQNHSHKPHHTPRHHHTPPPHHHTPPPHHSPPPHQNQTPSLEGTLAGGYAIADLSLEAGTRYDLAGIADLTGLGFSGEVMFTGELHSTGFLRSSHAGGQLTLAGAHGTVTLDLEGPAQGAFAALPEHFHFTVERGTGAFAHLHEAGTVTVHLFRATQTLTLDLESGR